jgi:DNA-3-methyladenine glycosylase
VSCLPEGVLGEVLLRALTPLHGRETMARNRVVGIGAGAKMLSGGPGKLCQAFGITREYFNGLDLTANQSPLQLLDDGVHSKSIEVTPRIGISKAVDRPLRFLLSE